MPGVELVHVELLLLSLLGHQLRFIFALPDREREVNCHLALPPASFLARPVAPAVSCCRIVSFPIQLVELQIPFSIAK